MVVATTARCPGEATIVLFARGELAAARQGDLERHLDGCPACCAVVADAGNAIDTGRVRAQRRTSESGTAGAPETGGGPVDRRRAVLGRYVLREAVGLGGMGVVYAAYDPHLRRDVAIKLLHSTSVGHDRLLREARAMARLSHPNVVAIHDVGEHDGRVFVAMEYVRGTTLRRWVEESRRSWREVVDVFLAAGRGLAAAHQARIIHRDFKPENVLLGADGRIRVTDFGLARPLDRGGEGRADSSETTRPEWHAWEPTSVWNTVGLAGTPPYMSPEQLTGRAVDARTDQYSFCVALYEALFGRRPIPGDTFEEVAGEVMAGRIARPLRASVPRRVRHVVLRGLALSADRRYPSMTELLAALSRARRPRARAGLAVAAGALVMATAAAVAGAFALSGGPPGEPAPRPGVAAGGDAAGGPAAAGGDAADVPAVASTAPDGPPAAGPIRSSGADRPDGASDAPSARRGARKRADDRRSTSAAPARPAVPDGSAATASRATRSAPRRSARPPRSTPALGDELRTPSFVRRTVD